MRGCFFLRNHLTGWAFALPPAKADEVWSSDYGKVVYQTNRGKTAIWTYGDSAKGIVFIDGLADQLNERSYYYGYWAQSSSKVRCDTYREGRDGKPTYYWGTFNIQFLETTFLARWSADYGYCDELPVSQWRGTPIVGQERKVPSALP